VNYFELLGLTREPFSNSPDPVFFYKSQNHAKCLYRLEIAIRLRRGLNVCLGQIGSGKSTLCRTLIQRLSRDETVVPHLVLDPSFATPKELLVTLYTRFLRTPPPSEATHRDMMEALQYHLFQEAQEYGKIIVLIIDEGQKLVPACLEVIRELLNYETNDAKLLQVVIFAQEEFDVTLAEMPNFQDRINEFCRLTPLSFRDTRAMIRHRLTLAGSTRALFTWPAYVAIYRVTRGHPRKIMHLGHKTLLTLIVAGKSRVTRDIVLSCALPLGWDGDRQPVLAFLAATVLFAPLVLFPQELNISVMSQVRPEISGSSIIRAPVSREPHPLAESNGTLPVAGEQGHQDNEVSRAGPGEPSGVPSGARAGEGLSSLPASAANNTLDQENPGEPEGLVQREGNPAPPPTPGLTIRSDERASIELSPIFSGSRFYIQVGAFTQQRPAEELARTMRQRHESAAILRASYKGRLWHVVYIAHFDSAGKAIRKAREIRREEGQANAVVEAVGTNYRFVWK
jgi:general secretion pathway protein A